MKILRMDGCHSPLVLLRMDAIRSLLAVVYLRVDGYHSLANGCYMKTAIFYFWLYSFNNSLLYSCCQLLNTCVAFCFRSRRGSGCQARQKIRDWRRFNEHDALTADTHDDAPSYASWRCRCESRAFANNVSRVVGEKLPNAWHGGVSSAPPRSNSGAI